MQVFGYETGIHRHHLFPRPCFFSRRFQAYCVGTSKSGTHSIDGLFKKRFRSAHEVESHLITELVLKNQLKETTRAEIRSWVQKRDWRLRLEMDSSYCNYFIIDELLEAFPKSLYILTIRDCCSWLDSMINQTINGPFNHKINNLRFKTEEWVHSEQEAVLKELNLPTIDGYLSFWSEHNQKILDAIPSERLLIVKTSEITQSTGRIAQFLGIDCKSLDITQSHQYQAKTTHNILSKIDKKFLQEKYEQHCKELMERFFPDVDLSAVHSSKKSSHPRPGQDAFCG